MSCVNTQPKRLDADDVRADAAGRWLEIFQDLCPGVFDDAIRHLGEHVNCPFHGGENDFRFLKKGSKKGGNTATTGVALCTCGTHDGFSVIMKGSGRSFSETLRAVDQWLHGDAIVAMPRPATPIRIVVPEDTAEADREKLARINKLYSAGKPMNHQDVPYYKQRGISPLILADVQDVRYLPMLGYYQKAKSAPGEPPKNELVKVDSFPAILAAMRNVAGELIAVHRTWLAKDRLDKAPVLKAKKLSETPNASGAAIRLFDAKGADTLGLTEGVETGLGVRQLSAGRYWPQLGKIPVWSCYSAGNIEAFVIPEFLKATLKTLIIFADNDESGRGAEAALKLKERLAVEWPELEVRIEMPEVVGCDWLDILVNL